MTAITAADIDALLPQTQCGLCGFAGCMPYAQALANKTAEINLCPPGGVTGLVALADLLNKDATPFISAMAQKAKPASVAVIREAECIGCTKCIQACPVDAILGSGKNMHTIIAQECTGCELCIAPCPVDCIDIITLPTPTKSEEKTKANLARQRFNARNVRLANGNSLRNSTHDLTTPPPTHTDKQAFIQAALLRKKLKK